MTAAAAPPAVERTAAIRRATARLCLQRGWSPLHEVTLANGRRADILALRPDGGLACIEIKSGPSDFRSDTKWQQYRDFCDALYFAVDLDFPRAMLPEDTGLIVAWDNSAEILREAPPHPLPPARRKAVTHRFARLAAARLCALEDPEGSALLRIASRAA